MSDISKKVQSRGVVFEKKLESGITQEIPSDTNPFLIKDAFIHGYNHLELSRQYAFSDLIYLLFRGELPNLEQATLFQTLCNLFINPGPRHPASQSAMVCGASKTAPSHILPVALTVFSGEQDGCANIQQTVKHLAKFSNRPTQDYIEQNHYKQTSAFGCLYGSADTYAGKMLTTLSDPTRTTLQWLKRVHDTIGTTSFGVTKIGVFSAAALDLGFTPIQSISLLQLIAAPGLAAQGTEYINKPLQKMLFEDDDHYDLEDELSHHLSQPSREKRA